MLKDYLKQNKRVVIILAAVPIVSLAWFIFALLYQGSTKEIVSVADQFKPDPSWVLESETINPPQIICIDSVCPKVSRAWRISGLSNQDIALIKQSYRGVLIQDQDCIPSEMGGFVSICSFEGEVAGYKIRFSVNQSNEDSATAKISQFIE